MNSLMGILCFFCVALLCLGLQHDAMANASSWHNNRIAISSDGNPDADPDDIGATPMTLAVIAKAGLHNNLVHYDFNNWLEYKKIDADKNDMWKGAMGAQARWGLDRSKFFDAASDPQAAIDNLAAEISKSTAADPLYLIVAGPMELIYQAMLKADKASLIHVKLVTHSIYNDYFKARLWQHNLDDVLKLNPEIAILRIPDQNRYLRTKSTYEPWYWLRDHADPNLRWVYGRLEAGRPDVSDTGMLTWLIGLSGSDALTTMAELQTFIGDQPILTNGGSPKNTLPAPVGVDPEIHLPETKHIFLEVDGRIVIEAESVPLTGDWKIETSELGGKEEKYIRYMPEDINVAHSKARGVLTYKLRITNPGTYRMAFRHSHRGAPTNKKWGYTWTLMGIDVAPFGEFRKTFHSISDEAFNNGAGFSFNTTHDNYGLVARREGPFSEPLYDLSAGEHYFFVAGRSGGYRLDKIHFFKQGVNGFKEESSPATPIVRK